VTFSQSEIDNFDEYAALLIILCEQEHGGFDGRTMLAHKCPACARRVLAGIPMQLRQSEYDVCPACVRIKRMVSPLRVMLGKAAEEIGKPIKDTHAFRSQLRGPDAVIPKRRTDRMRILIATMNERAARSPNEPEARKWRRLVEVLERVVRAAEGTET